jgi:hypothetical protein
MRIKEHRMALLLAIALAGVSCERKPTAAASDTDAAKLRPEVAAAQKIASPTPLPDATVRSTPAP